MTATKKSFKNENPALAFINTHHVQDTQEEQEAQRTPIAHSTQGKKGQKLPRINMAFSRDNLEYLQIISRVEGVSITEYVNRMVEVDKAAKQSIFEEAKKILKPAEVK